MKNYIINTNKRDKNVKDLNNGITLIALVVTIVVLLILAGITINMLFSENGIITKARQAAEETAKAEENELAGMQGVADEIDKIIASGSNNEITNPYEPDGWVKAWTCTDGIWSDEISAGTTISDDVDVVAKLYETGNKITPQTFSTRPNMMGSLGGQEFSFPESNEYHIVIEGQGNMGELISVDEGMNITNAFAWQYSMVTYLMGTSDTCIAPYITEAYICDGITNVGNFAFDVAISLEKIHIGKDVTTIEPMAMMICLSLESINLPNSITEIGNYAFYDCRKLKNITLSENLEVIGIQTFSACESLENITIPSSLINLAQSSFRDCTSLEKVKILTTNENLTIGTGIFTDMAENSKIYVLNEDVKTKLEGTYSSSKTTVQVVTQDEMNKL